MSSKLRVAIIGCGYFATNHMNAWLRLGVDIAGVCDVDPAKAKSAAERFGAPKWFTDAGEMLRAVKPDFVDIITTMPTHHRLVTLAASEKIPVIVQKPFAPTWEECLSMVDACDKAGVPLMVHENFRFQPALRRVHDVLQTGVIGDILFGKISFRTGQDVKAPQPYLYNETKFILLDFGVHALDVARVFLGEANTVFCRHRRVDPRIKGEDMATVMMGHVNTATSITDFTYESRKLPDYASQTLVSIEGTKGAVEVYPGFKVAVTEGNKLTVEDPPTIMTGWPHGWEHAAQDSVYYTEKHWVDCFRAGKEPEVSGHDNLKTYALVDACYKSNETGQAETPLLY
jgi:predicted dehydrogenase